MRVSIVIATAGAPEWSELAWSRAYPSAVNACAPGTIGTPNGVEIRIEHYPELSVPEARNAAAAEAWGDWLCFLDADDELAPGYVDAMTRAWHEHAATMDWSPLLAPALHRTHPDCRTEGPGIPNQGRWPVLNECCIGTMIRHDRFDRIGGFQLLPSLEDYDLFLRAFDDGAEIVHVPDAVYRECVSVTGRNRDQRAYQAIWADHLARVAA